MSDALWILAGIVFGLVVTTKLRWQCVRWGMLAGVNNRSAHAAPKPQGVGLAFALLMLPVLLGLALYAPLTNTPFVWALTAAGAVMALLGWWDDARGCPWALRLLVQLLCVGVCLVYLPPVLPGIVPLWAEKGLFLLAWMWFINLYNFMDGIDGFATMQAIFLAFALTFVALDLKPALSVLMGTGIAFLRINWAPSKAFMGDAGSVFLGFMLAGIMFYTLTPALIFSYLILTLLFGFDATYTLIRRVLCGKKPWQAHSDHLYQRAVRAGVPHDKVVLYGVAINILLAVLAVLAAYAATAWLYLVIALFLCGIVAWKMRGLK